MEEQGETRKIQFTGKSSYIVSLPKQWINELGLKQGDQVRMVRKGSSTLELYPPKFESRIQKKEDATIEIAEDEKADSLVRKLVSLYFLGFKTINLKLTIIDHNSEKEILEKFRDILKNQFFNYEILKLDIDLYQKEINKINEEGKEVTQNQISNMSNIHQSLNIAKNCQDLVYFVEDDYLHQIE